jgi:hypothetical protein
MAAFFDHLKINQKLKQTLPNRDTKPDYKNQMTRKFWTQVGADSFQSKQ